MVWGKKILTLTLLSSRMWPYVVLKKFTSILEENVAFIYPDYGDSWFLRIFVHFYQPTWLYVTEGNHPHRHHNENPVTQTPSHDLDASCLHKLLS